MRFGQSCGMKRLSILLLLAALPLFVGTVCAQGSGEIPPAPPAAADEGPPPDRPRTCLVLSGGGARGAAHIGVLRVLEQLRVPIDCVVGTSMGAIIGGAWAAGISPDRIEESLRNARWERVLSDDPDRPQRSVRNKELERRRFGGAEFGVRSGTAVLPTGAVAGQQLDLFLASLYGPPTPNMRFDDLPIPFRALATDIETGQLIVIDRGSISQAVRASMSVPGAFAPQEIDGRLLVDGGLVRNLGVDVARALGAKRVIAVNLGTTLSGRDALNSLVGVTGQMIAILTEQNVQVSVNQLGPNDVLISPELGDFSAVDFAGAVDIVPLGESAARKLEPALAAFSMDAPQYAAWNAAKQSRRPVAPTIEVIRIDTAELRHVNPDVAQAVFSTAFRSGTADTALQRAIDALYATDSFQQISARTEIGADSLSTLVIEPREKTWGPDFLRLGLTLDTDFEGNSGFTVLGDYRETWMNQRGLEWRTTGSLGDINSLRTELRQPLDLALRWTVNAGVGWQQRIDESFADDTAVARLRQNTLRGSLDVGRRFGTSGEWRFGIERERFASRVVTGDRSVALPSQDASLLFSRMTFDQLDSWDFPRSGYFLRADLNYAARDLGGDLDYRRLSVEWQGAAGGPRHSLSLLVRHEDSLGSILPIQGAFSLGGFENMSGLSARQILANQISFARVVYSRQLGRSGALVRGVYVGGSLEAASVRERLNSLDPTYEGLAGSLFMSLDTRLGPFYLAGGMAESGEAAFYLFLGRP